MVPLKHKGGLGELRSHLRRVHGSSSNKKLDFQIQEQSQEANDVQQALALLTMSD